MFLDWLFKKLGGKMEVKNDTQIIAPVTGQALSLTGNLPGNDADLQNAGLAVHVAGTTAEAAQIAPQPEPVADIATQAVADQTAGQHSHSVSSVAMSMSGLVQPSQVHSIEAATAVVNEVDKLEAAYSVRIQHVRALMKHLGQEAERDVMALFNKFPVSHGD